MQFALFRASFTLFPVACPGNSSVSVNTQLSGLLLSSVAVDPP